MKRSARAHRNFKCKKGCSSYHRVTARKCTKCPIRRKSIVNNEKLHLKIEIEQME